MCAGSIANHRFPLFRPQTPSHGYWQAFRRNLWPMPIVGDRPSELLDSRERLAPFAAPALILRSPAPLMKPKAR
jgi:hypothetical protein